MDSYNNTIATCSNYFNFVIIIWSKYNTVVYPIFTAIHSSFNDSFSAFKMNEEFAVVSKYHSIIEAYRRILKHFEKTKFHTEYINELKVKLTDDKGIAAVEQLKKLEIILNRLQNRKNMMFFPINVITLWDYQCRIDLEKWIRKSELLIEKWMEVIGELEALSSLAVIGHDFPNCAISIITEEDSIINSKSIGHPLLTNKQVHNDVTLQELCKVLLITGSNMSGKSTFLRTIGINLILAYSGAPVCATSMTCSIFSIHTCIRTSDNLENSGVSGLVSTHDLELGSMEVENEGKVKNLHF